MLAGTVARTIAVTIVSPLEMIRTKMQSEQHSYKGVLFSILYTADSQYCAEVEYVMNFKGFTAAPNPFLHFPDIGRALRVTVSTFGLSGFYLGWMPTLLRDIPFSGW